MPLYSKPYNEPRRLHFHELPPFEIGEPYKRVPTDQCPIEVQQWIMELLMAKRFHTKVPPFPHRFISRYFGHYDINEANNWGINLKDLLKDCVPPDQRTDDGGLLNLPDWPDGTPVFPLDIPKRPR